MKEGKAGIISDINKSYQIPIDKHLF